MNLYPLQVNEGALDLVRHYQVARTHVQTAYAELREANKVYGEHIAQKSELQVLFVSPNEKTALLKLKVETWKTILNRSGFQKLVSKKRKDEFKQACDIGSPYRPKDNLPEITEENVISFLNTMIENSTLFLEETVKEVFAFLRPGRNGGKLKTNAGKAEWRIR